MDELARRITRLEREREVAAATRAYSALVDEGPYDADALVEDWADDGVFDTGSDVFGGRQEIHRFFADLAATYTIHYSTNLRIELDDSLEAAEISSYGLEGPVIADQSVVGGFGHHARARRQDGRWVWTERKQRIHFLSPSTGGWTESGRVIEQRSSKGATPPSPEQAGS